jgi:3-oxoacyl-[acyl-carrier-protein] synthase-3
MHSRIAGTGSYLPAQILTNDDLAKRVDTSDDWIRTRSGIRERRFAAPTEKTSDLAEHAARAALAAAGIAPGTSISSSWRRRRRTWSFRRRRASCRRSSVRKAVQRSTCRPVCSGFVYALAVADRMVASGMAKNALVVGAEIYSRILDWNDRGSCVLFGDGAGAVVLVPSPSPASVQPICMRTAATVACCAFRVLWPRAPSAAALTCTWMARPCSNSRFA